MPTISEQLEIRWLNVKTAATNLVGKLEKERGQLPVSVQAAASILQRRLDELAKELAKESTK